MTTQGNVLDEDQQNLGNLESTEQQQQPYAIQMAEMKRQLEESNRQREADRREMQSKLDKGLNAIRADAMKAVTELGIEQTLAHISDPDEKERVKASMERMIRIQRGDAVADAGSNVIDQIIQRQNGQQQQPDPGQQEQQQPDYQAHVNQWIVKMSGGQVTSEHPVVKAGLSNALNQANPEGAINQLIMQAMAQSGNGQQQQQQGSDREHTPPITAFGGGQVRTNAPIKSEEILPRFNAGGLTVVEAQAEIKRIEQTTPDDPYLRTLKRTFNL